MNPESPSLPFLAWEHRDQIIVRFLRTNLTQKRDVFGVSAGYRASYRLYTTSVAKAVVGKEITEKEKETKKEIIC